MENIKTELCIIGGGAGGLSLAAAASQLGVKVVLVEKNKMGGDCLNSGCVPSKALLAAAKHRWQCLNNHTFGFTVQRSHFDFSKVMAHVKQTIADIAPHDSVERFEGLGCQVILGQGQFSNDHTLQVNNKNIQAKRFVIATGSSPFIPPVKGLANINFFSNENIFNITKLPQHLIIIGGGIMACELGQAFAMLGSKVSLLIRSTLLRQQQPDCVELLRQSMLKMNIDIYEQASIESVAELNHRMVAVIQHQAEEKVLTGSHILVATGRKANTEDLTLAKANIELDAKQAIKVNKRLQTSNKKIFAIGDVIGQQPFTHMANHHAGIVLKNLLFRLPAKLNRDYIPQVIYTVPEIAHVGINAEQAQQQNLSIEITETPYQDNDRARCQAYGIGKIKIISDKKGRVLGVTIIGEHAGELLMPWLTLVKNKQSLRKLTDLIIPYPTLSELSKRSASSFFHPRLFSDKVRKIVSWIKAC